MKHSAVAHADAAVLPADDVLFTPVELMVVDLAVSERGSGIGPASRFLRALTRFQISITGSSRMQALADDRLEALRIFVNALHRRGHWLGQQATIDLRGAGFSAIQEAWLRARYEQPVGAQPLPA